MMTGNRPSRKMKISAIALVFSWHMVSCQVAPPTAIPTDSGVIETLSVLSVETPTEAPIITPTPVPQPTVPFMLEASEVGYVIPLHVQHKTQDQLIVMYELNTEIAGRVYWWPTDGSYQNANFVPFEAGGGRHLTRIQGLEPGQTYTMAIGLEGADGVDRMPIFLGEPWGLIEVSTLAEALFPVTIGVFGDSGFGEDLTADLASQLAQHQPDLIIHTGDLVYSAHEQGNSLDAYRLKWYQTISSLLRSTVVYPVVGNHELYADTNYRGMPFYFYAFPMFEEISGGWSEAPIGTERQWYALELGPIQMLFLNTQQFYGGPARTEQDAWLKARLMDERFKTSIVVFHVPPFTSGRYIQDGRPVVSSWVPEFEASNVALVLSGHDHNYQRLEHHGITYIISGGGSSALYPLEQWHADSLRFEARTHFVLLEVEAESIEIKAFDKYGEMFDSDTIKFTR